MGCCFSLKMSSSLQGERSALLQPPHHHGLGEVTEELRQHAIAVVQHVSLEEEGDRDSSSTCEEETRVLLGPHTVCHPNLENPHQEKTQVPLGPHGVCHPNLKNPHQEKIQVLLGPHTICHPNLENPDQEKLDSSDMEAWTSRTHGVGSDPCVELDTGRKENAPDGSEQVWLSPFADILVSEASGERQAGKEEEVCVVKTEPYQGFKTKTFSFYSICSIDTDDLEQGQSQSPTAGGAAALLHVFTPPAEQKNESGPVFPPQLVPSSEPLIPTSSLWTIQAPLWVSPHADEAPEEPSMTSHTAPGTCEGGSEGLHTQQEDDLEENLDSGFTDDHLDECEPPAEQQSASILTAAEDPGADSLSLTSSLLTLTPPPLNQARLSPSETSSGPPPHQPTPVLHSHFKTSSDKLQESDSFSDPGKSAGHESDPKSTRSGFEAEPELLQLPEDPQTLQEVPLRRRVSVDGCEGETGGAPSSLCTSPGGDEAEREDGPAELLQNQQQLQTADVPTEVSEPQNNAAQSSHPPGGSNGLDSGECSEEVSPAGHPCDIPAETFPDQTGSSVYDSASQADLTPIMTSEDPAQVDAHASTPSYLIHSRPEQQTLAESSSSSGGGRMREMVWELLGDDADVPICDPEPWIRLGLEESSRAWAQGPSLAEVPQMGIGMEEIPALVSELQPSMALLGAYPYSTVMPQGACVWDWHTDCSQLVRVTSTSQQFLGLTLGCPPPQGPAASPSLNHDAEIWNNPDFGLEICSLAQQEVQQLWTRFSSELSGYEGTRLELCLSSSEVSG